MNSELAAWIFLNHLPDLGPVRFHRLLLAAGSAVEILPLSVPALCLSGAPEGMAQEWHRLIRNRDFNRKVDDEIARIEKGDYAAISELDDVYPDALRELLDRPPVLYVKGQWPPPAEVFIGVVGTRRPSPYGLAATERLVKALCERHVITVSGMAIGIDRVVHVRTMASNGFTIGVLGNGLGSIYPKSNADLYGQVPDRGALVTEFPFGMGPQTYHFPRRNRIIAGLSQGVLVIEASERSGALITARNATENGRDVFVVPGRIFDETNAGGHRLIKSGAKLVTSADDVFEEYESLRSPATKPEALKPEKNLSTEVSPETPVALKGIEADIYQQMMEGDVSIDELTETLEKPVDVLANALLMLELKGKIRRLPGQRYANTFT